MAGFGARPALCWGGREVSYRELLDQTMHWRAERAALSEGSWSLVGDFSPAACALLLSGLDRNGIAVPLTAATAAQHAELLAIAGAAERYEIDSDDEVRRVSLATGREHPMYAELRASGRPGLVLFSSGSTGAHKAILHDLDRVAERFRRPRRAMVTVTFLLLDHMGGISTLLGVLASGGTVVPVRTRTADEVCRAVERHRVELLPATPTFFNLMLMSEAHRRHDLSSLRLVTYGTEPMPAQTLRRLQEALPHVELKQTYGLSELGVFSSRSETSGSLWMSIGGDGVETRVQDGTLRVRSPAAMVGYLNAPSPFDEDGWLDTQDLVERRGDFVRIVGRRSEVINVAGQKVHPTEVESVLLELDNVRDALVLGRRNPVTGQVVEARLQLERPEPGAALLRRVREHCAGRLERHQIPMIVTVADGELHGARFKKQRRDEAT